MDYSYCPHDKLFLTFHSDHPYYTSSSKRSWGLTILIHTPVWFCLITGDSVQKSSEIWCQKSRGHEVTVGFWGMRSTVPMFSTTLSRKPYLVAVNEDLELWRPDCLQVWYQVGEVGNALLDFWYWLVLWLVWCLPVELSSFLCFWPCFYMCKIARFAPFSFARWGDG